MVEIKEKIEKKREEIAKRKLGHISKGRPVRVISKTVIFLIILAMRINGSHSNKYLKSYSFKEDHALYKILLIGYDLNQVWVNKLKVISRCYLILYIYMAEIYSLG